MAGPLRSVSIERDVEQAITALKKGAQLLKYGRRGKPKFCPFRLSNDESLLIWYAGKGEKRLKLGQVSKIIPGQRTAIFQRYPRPDKEYQSFSLIYSNRSLDLICKDKDEAEVWFVGLKALISRGNGRKWRLESRGDRISSDSPSVLSQGNSPLTSPFFVSDIFNKDSGDSQQINLPYDSHPANGFGDAFSDLILYTAQSAPDKCLSTDSASNSLSPFSSLGADNSNSRGSAIETVRVSLSSAVSSSSHGSAREDFDALGDVFIWGEGIGEGLLGGGLKNSTGSTMFDTLLPKTLESAIVLDVQNIACGHRHAVLVTRQGEIYSWGEESGGRLGHGVDADVPHPKLIDALSGMNVELVACGEYHTCAVTLSGDLYTWGDGTHSSGLLGNGSDASHWIPKKVFGQLEGLQVSSVSCGPWHTAIVTSSGQLFTCGDGTFGALGHGDRRSMIIPREVEALQGMRTIRAACGVWHTAAIVEPSDRSDSDISPSGLLFTWGDGDKGRIGHGDGETRLLPACVATLPDKFREVACGHDITVALTTFGQVYTMGNPVYGQLGNPKMSGKGPTRVEGKISDCFVEEISCGSYHVAVLTSKTEVYTWGKGANGRLGHGDNDDRNIPTLVEALKDKQVKSVVCGANFTAVICLHKWVSGADQTICFGCHLPFGFRRKSHNCYNCGLVFCKACTSKRSIRASLAPNLNKPYRVCDDCYIKLKKTTGDAVIPRFRKTLSGNFNHIPTEAVVKDSLEHRLQAQLSRLSSVDSFKGEPQQSKKSNANRLPSILHQLGILYPSNSSKLLQGTSKKIFSASVPTSRVASRSTSPVPCRQSPPRSIATHKATDLISLDGPSCDSGQMTEDIHKEVVRLQAQVEELTCKTRLLEMELQKNKRQLQEAKLTQGEEAAKCKAANDVIKSLTSQLKDMAEKEPEGGAISDKHGPSCTSAALKVPSLDNVNVLLESQAEDSNNLLRNSLLGDGSTALLEETDWVEQAGPGVYLTVSSNGVEKILKCVRFSRKRFSDQQAEKWWAENRTRLQLKYIILNYDNSSTTTTTTSVSEKKG